MQAASQKNFQLPDFTKRFRGIRDENMYQRSPHLLFWKTEVHYENG
jgi:hypothetical protein